MVPSQNTDLVIQVYSEESTYIILDKDVQVPYGSNSVTYNVELSTPCDYGDITIEMAETSSDLLLSVSSVTFNSGEYSKSVTLDLSSLDAD